MEYELILQEVLIYPTETKEYPVVAPVNETLAFGSPEKLRACLTKKLEDFRATVVDQTEHLVKIDFPCHIWQMAIIDENGQAASLEVIKRIVPS